MKRAAVWLFVVTLLMTGSSQAFDGLRKGFVLGGGLGFSPYSKWSIEITGQFYGQAVSEKVDETNTGPGVDFIIGYAWDEQNMIVYEGNGLIYNSEFFGKSSYGGLVAEDSRQAAQAFNGIAFYHYFGPVGRAAFAAVGVGGYAWKVTDFEANDPGPAYLIGAGYEFVRHIQAGVFVSGGRTTDSGFDFGHMHVNVTVVAVAF